jgi:hypothetical protein
MELLHVELRIRGVVGGGSFFGRCHCVFGLLKELLNVTEDLRRVKSSRGRRWPLECGRVELGELLIVADLRLGEDDLEALFAPAGKHHIITFTRF